MSLTLPLASSSSISTPNGYGHASRIEAIVERPPSGEYAYLRPEDDAPRYGSPTWAGGLWPWSACSADWTTSYDTSGPGAPVVLAVRQLGTHGRRRRAQTQAARRCTRCGLSVVANEVEVLPAPKPVGATDWTNDEPKRVRPLGSKNKRKVAA